MIKKILPKLLVLTVLVGLAFAFVPAGVHAQSAADVCRGVGTAGGGAGGCGGGGGARTINGIIGAAVNILAGVVGVVAVIMIIIAGFKYVTSGGDASSVSSAKQTIIYAIVGVIVAVSARAIAVYVLGRAT